jgi:hypothetical protein
MLGGRMVWVGMSRGRFVGGRNVKAPAILPCLLLADSLFSQIFQHTQTIGPFAQRVSILFRLSRQLSNNLLDHFPSMIFNPKRTRYRGARHRPGEVKLDLIFLPIARDRRGLKKKILVHEGGYV